MEYTETKRIIDEAALERERVRNTQAQHASDVAIKKLELYTKALARYKLIHLIIIVLTIAVFMIALKVHGEGGDAIEDTLLVIFIGLLALCFIYRLFKPRYPGEED